jgi:hypothetical protein
MTKRAQLISEREADRLQEAGEDVAYLTQQGMHPTDAIAKVASIAGFTKDQTNLLIYSYSAGMAAEKRANSGGPFERLAEYPLPDPKKVFEIVYGSKPGPVKTASAGPAFDLRWVDKDFLVMSDQEIRALFNPTGKTAEKEEKPKNLTISKTSVSISLAPECKESDCEEDSMFIDFIPETAEECMKAGMKMMSPSLQNEIDTALRRMMREAKTAQIAKYAEAGDEYALLVGLVKDFGKQVRRMDSDSYKMAGFASVHAYYPDIAALLIPFMDEILTRKIKSAGYSDLDVGQQHNWVAQAKNISKQLIKVAEATEVANQSKDYYDALSDLYYNRPIGELADWTKFANVGLLGAGVLGGTILGTMSMAKGLGHASLKSTQENPLGTATVQKLKEKDTPSPDKKKDLREDTRRDLLSPLKELNRKDIATMGMLSDFSANDEILSAYSLEDLVNTYNDLVQTAPNTMRDRSTSRAVLQQLMTQGRMSPTEYEPVLKLDKYLSEDGQKVSGQSVSP